RRRGHARLDVPPRARLDRPLGVSLARLSGNPVLGPPGRTPGYDEKPHDRPRGRREQPSLHLGARPRGPQRPREDRALELREEGMTGMSVSTRANTSTAAAAKVPVVNWKKEQVGEVSLPAGVFAYPYRKHLVWEVVKAYLAGQRAGTHKT